MDVLKEELIEVLSSDNSKERELEIENEDVQLESELKSKKY